MKNLNASAWLFIFPFLCGCTAIQLSTEVQKGRAALIVGRPDVALPYFQRAAAIDPTFVMNFGIFKEGVWTYVGRAQYVTEKLPEARQSLERAVSSDEDDSLAKLYLGMTLAREGDRPRGLKEMQTGLTGLHEWLEWISSNRDWGIYWDPRREIRSQIQTNLAMISGKEINIQAIITSGEEIGYKMEREIDLARRDEIEAYKDTSGNSTK